MTPEQTAARDLAVSKIEQAAALMAEANKLMVTAELWKVTPDANELHQAYAAAMTARNNLLTTKPVTA